MRGYILFERRYALFRKKLRKNFSDIDTARASMSENSCEFPSEKLHPIFNESVHFLAHITKYCSTPNIPKMRVFTASRPGDTVIFERTQLGITPNILLTQNIPRLPAGARLPTVFLSSWRKRSISRRGIFLLSFSKEGRKTRNFKQRETLKKNYKIYANNDYITKHKHPNI